MKQIILAVFLLAFSIGAVSAQTHTAVNLDSRIYHILEQAEMRGLISPLSGVRPYTRSVVIRAINELLNSGSSALRLTERLILEDHLARLSPPQPGLDWSRGTFFAETEIGDSGIPLTFNFNVGMDFEFSSAFIPGFGETHRGGEIWINVDMSGDIGRNVSYGFYTQGGLVMQPRRFLGWYNTYYEGFEAEGHWATGEFVNRLVSVYSGPLTQFPFAYRGRWDGSIFPLDRIGPSGFYGWPQDLSGGYSLQAELTASFLEDRLIMRLGRHRREWGSMPLGSALTLSSGARPFLAVEAEFSPVPWLRLSSLTGVLEYENVHGIDVSAMTNQNAFSIAMLQLRFRNILFLDIIDAAIWPRRFELGYLSPISVNFFTQNNVGYFDNMALAANLRLQYPGIGNAWVSLFVDEMSLERDMGNLSRTMIAYQAGVNVPLPVFAFSSLRFSYTKINPFTYTHTRQRKPWHGDLLMETGWTNHGVALGHYLPPNSDQFLLKFTTMPTRNLSTVFQYRMIRRGANFGSGAVMGSDLRSELSPAGRSSDPRLRRYFLRDGAYQWMHVVRASADWQLPSLPVSLFGEAGVVFSYFTNTFDEDGNVVSPNSGRPFSFSRINTPEYPTSTTVIARIGFRVFR